MKNIYNISVFEEVFIPTKQIVKTQNQIIDHFSTNDFAYFHGIFAKKNRENGGDFFKQLILSEDLSYKADPEEARRNQLETYEKLSKMKKNQWKDHTYTADNRHTPRVHAKGFGWMQMGRQSRNNMFESYNQADLKSSQMSILVSYLGIKEFVEFYKKDLSLWDYLVKETGYAKADLKQKAKQIIYEPKHEITTLINGILVENMMDWKSTTAITIKEWNKLDKEIDFLIGQFRKGLFQKIVN